MQQLADLWVRRTFCSSTEGVGTSDWFNSTIPMPAPSRRRHARCPLRAQRAAGCSARAPWPAATTRHCSANTRAAYLRMTATPSQDASHARRASRAIAHPAVSRVTGTVQSERHARRHGRSAKPSPRRPLGPPSSVDLTVASSARQCRRKLSCRIFHLRQGTRLPRRGCSLRIPRYAPSSVQPDIHTPAHQER